jgi:methyl-accepting chemotaxis protein
MSLTDIFGKSLSAKVVLPILVVLVLGFSVSTWFGASRGGETIGALSENIGGLVAREAQAQAGQVIEGGFQVARGIAAMAEGAVSAGSCFGPIPISWAPGSFSSPMPSTAPTRTT